MIDAFVRTRAGLGLLLLFFSTACQTKHAELLMVGTVDLPLQLAGSSAKMYGQPNELTMSFFNYTDGQSIALTKGTSFEPFHELIIPKSLQFRVYSYHVNSLDSVLLHEPYVEYNRLTWVGSHGRILSSYSLNEILPEPCDTYSRPATPLLFHEDKALVYYGRNMDIEYYQKNAQLPLGQWVHLDTLNLNCTFSEYPNAYLGDSYFFNTSHNRPFTTQICGDTVLWAFHADSKVKIFQGCNLLHERSVESRYIHEVPAFPMEQYGIRSSEIEFGHSSAAYWRVYYNPWQKLIYRINFPSQVYQNKDGSFNLHENRPFSIQVINRDLELITETLITTSLNFQAAFAGPEGLYIKTHEEGNNKYHIYSLRKL